MFYLFCEIWALKSIRWIFLPERSDVHRNPRMGTYQTHGLFMGFYMLTPWKFKSLLLKIYAIQRKPACLPTIIFQGKTQHNLTHCLGGAVTSGEGFCVPWFYLGWCWYLFMILCHPLDPATGYQIMDASLFCFFSMHSYIVVYVIFPISDEGSPETSLWTYAGKVALDIQTIPEVRYLDPQQKRYLNYHKHGW